MNEFTIYMITRFDNIKNLFIAFVTIFSIVLFISIIMYFVSETNISSSKTNNDEKYWTGFRERALECIKIFITALVLSVTTLVLIPNTNEAALIFLFPKIANSSFIKEDMPKEAKEIYDLAKKYIKKRMGEKNDANTRTRD